MPVFVLIRPCSVCKKTAVYNTETRSKPRHKLIAPFSSLQCYYRATFYLENRAVIVYFFITTENNRLVEKKIVADKFYFLCETATTVSTRKKKYYCFKIEAVIINS